MRVLSLHNLYQQAGGEDVIFEQETNLLQSRGHEVRCLTADNRVIENLSAKVSAIVGTVFSIRAHNRVAAEINSFRPDLVHVHNFFPLLSPSVYFACADADVPVVQTLHNFRTICPSALLFRDGRVCEECVGRRVPWPGVMHKCYRNSMAGSGALAAMIGVHKLAGSWKQKVTAYIALTEFARQKFIAGGLPSDKLFLKPNFIYPDLGRGGRDGDFALFVGRLSPEKGIRTLLSAWNSVPSNYTLKIVGNGPLLPDVLRAADRRPQIEYMGQLAKEFVYKLMDSAYCLVFPSECYEGFPMVIAEAFAKGVPVIGSRLGSTTELVDHGRTGLLFEPGKPADLARSVGWAFSHPDEMFRMADSARAEFELKYTAERNYACMLEIYSKVTRVSN